jgi:uncharacterized protein
MDQIYYADSSVLVKRHVREIGSGWFSRLVAADAGNTVVTSSLSIVEVLSALNRRMREAAIDPADYQQLANDFLFVSNNEYHIVDFMAPVIAESRRILESYVVRAGDAIQLASAVLARKALLSAFPTAPIFLASDERLLRAAEAEGFTTDDPILHP